MKTEDVSRRDAEPAEKIESLLRRKGIMAIPKGVFHMEHYDRKGRLKDAWESENLITTQGLNAWLDIMFNGSTQIATWYIALFESNYTPLPGDTYAVPGYTECTAYDEATRPEFVEAAASGGVMTSSANKATFTFNATKTIYGAALVGGGTDPTVKANTAGGGTLFDATKWATSKAVESGEVLKVWLTITLTNAA